MGSHSITIRYATSTDIPLVVDLFQQVVAPLDIYSPAAREAEINKYALSELEYRFAKEPDFITIAAVDGKPCGFSISRDETGPVWLEWYGVTEFARKHGVGRLIIEHLISESRMRGSTRVWCDTRTNNIPSMALFESLGFRKLCELPNHWHGQDFFLWEKTL